MRICGIMIHPRHVKVKIIMFAEASTQETLPQSSNRSNPSYTNEIRIEIHNSSQLCYLL